MHRRRFITRSTLAAGVLLGVIAPLACGSDGAQPAAAINPDAAIAGPSSLSETGLYADVASKRLAPEIRRFAPAHPLWADGAEKTRLMLLPPGTKIDTSDMDRWVFPVGTKLWKEFRVDGKLVETRFLWKRRSDAGFGSWWASAYVWDADGRQAVATVDGAPSALGTSHDVPSQEDCSACHSYVRDAVIGFSAIELSPPTTDVPGGPNGDPADLGLLMAFANESMFSAPPAGAFTVPGTGNVRATLGYLHGNCGFCHNERLEELIKRKIRFRLSTSETTPSETGAYTTTIHTKMFHELDGDGGVADEAIVPGEPERSQVYVRMTASGFVRMPPKATKVVDPYGTSIVREWILGLPR